MILTTGNNVSLTTAEHRNQTAALLPPAKVALAVRGGVQSGLALSKTSGMTFRIAPGRAIVPPISPSTGPYTVTVVDPETLTFEAGDASRNRIDVVAVKVDEADATDRPGSIVIIKGAYPSAGSPVVPNGVGAHVPLYAVPINAGVNAGSGGFNAAAAVDLRKNLVALGAAIPVNGTAERDALLPYEGMQVMRLDLEGSIDRYVNGRWRGNTDWINCTYSAGWRGVTNGTPLRVKLTADGNLGMIGGEVIFTTASYTLREGDAIGHIPPAAMTAGITPDTNAWVIGTDASYKGLVVIQVTADGTIRLGPAPDGKSFMFQGTFPLQLK